MSRPIRLRTKSAYRREIQTIGRLRQSLEGESRVPKDLVELALKYASSLEKTIDMIVKRLDKDDPDGRDIEG